MRIRLLKPFRQIGRIVPAGVILDGPDGLCDRLIRKGIACLPDEQKQEQKAKKSTGRGRMKHDG